jgi:16S rRNA (cytosine1402-N4)-methyltransferase
VRHEPVLVAEVVTLIAPRPDGIYVDCTVGLGGHTEALFEAGAGRVIGIDRDSDALAHARARLSSFGGVSDRLDLVHADYRELPAILHARGIDAIDGALVDLGVSSWQLDEPARGFTFRQDGPLDMRMDQSSGTALAERLRTVDEATLADVIYQFGEERHARRVARAIVRARDREPLERTSQLASIVRRAAGGGTWQRIDPATRTFQALRIWINRELEGLDAFLEAAAGVLRTGRRLVVIAFHSLEDRIVKHTFRRLSQPPAVLTILTRRPVEPGDAEIQRNPRARSARMRAAERLA